MELDHLADDALALRARDGDRAAFDQLVRLHQGRLRAFLAVRLHDQSAVDDLAQDSFVIAFQRLDTFDPQRPFYPWLRGIALNVLRTHFRQHRLLPHEQDELQELLDNLVGHEAESQGDHDRIALLRRCLGELTGRMAELVRAHYFDGDSLDLIAQRQQCSASAIGMALMRTRRGLGECIRGKLAAVGSPA